MRTEPQAESVQAKPVPATAVLHPNRIQVVGGADISGVNQGQAADALRLRRRAESLRARSASMEGPLRVSYRRRASELMLQAWLIEVRSGLPFTDIAPAA